MDEGDALRTLDAILARPEYAEDAVTLYTRLRQMIEQRLIDLIFAILGPADDAVRTGWGQLGLVVAGVLVVGGIVYYLARSAGLSIVRSSARLDEHDQVRVRERSDRLWQEAQAAAGSGQYLEASRLVYLSALYALEEHALLRVQEALTNREHALRLAAEHPTASGVFAALVGAYDRLRYGGGVADQDQFAELRRLAGEARALSA